MNRRCRGEVDAQRLVDDGAPLAGSTFFFGSNFELLDDLLTGVSIGQGGDKAVSDEVGRIDHLADHARLRQTTNAVLNRMSNCERLPSRPKNSALSARR